MICDECETVAHCLKNGCVPKHQALNRMAENARELGLNYEPDDGIQVSKVWWNDEKLMAKPIPFVEFYKPAPYVASQLVQQSRSDVEPVAWMWEQRAARSSSGIGGWDKLILFCKPVDDPFVEKRNLAPLYTTPPAQPLLKPLTKDQITKFYGGDSPLVFQIIREVEAHHGIKEKNT
jgi:hypothetical protein